jgi:8-oxo-dGTP diphosphatase
MAEAVAPAGAVLLVRHCSAGSADRFAGLDRLRPLDGRGRRQAAALADAVRAEFAVRSILSSPYLRCRQSMEPLAQAAGLPVEVAEALAQGGAEDAALRLVRGLPPGDAVLCSHGDVLPALLERLAAEDGLALGGGPAPCAKGSAWVLTMAAPGRFRAARYVPPRA